MFLSSLSLLFCGSFDVAHCNSWLLNILQWLLIDTLENIPKEVVFICWRDLFERFLQRLRKTTKGVIIDDNPDKNLTSCPSNKSPTLYHTPSLYLCKTCKFVLVYFMKVYRVRLDIAPLILDLGISLTLRE